MRSHSLVQRALNVLLPNRQARLGSCTVSSRRIAFRKPRLESLENRRVLAHLLNVEIVQVCNDNGTVCAELGPGDTSLAQPNEYAYEDEVNEIFAQADIQVNFSYVRFNSSATLDISTFAEANEVNNGARFRGFDGVQMFFVRSIPFFNSGDVQPGFSQNAGFTQQGVVNENFVTPTGRGLMANAGPARIEVASTFPHEIAHALGLSHINESTGLPNDPLVTLNNSQPNLMWEAGLGPAFNTGLNNALVANNPLTQAQINAMIANGTNPRFDVLEDLPDVTVSIGASSRNVNESAGTINVTATLSANAISTVTIPLSFGGNAQSDDYQALDNSITIPAGSRSGNARIEINNDDLDEPNETIVINLGTPNNGVTVSNGQQVITIVDDDDPPSPPVIDFENAEINFSISESDNEPLRISLTLDKPAPAAVTATLALGGTADDNDFAITTTNVTIPQGGQSFSTEIAASLDTRNETTESITIELTGLTGAVLGDNVTQTVSLLDSSDAENDNRILIPDSLSAPQQLPGDNRTTAILFAVASDTTVRVSGDPTASAIQLLDPNLESIGVGVNAGVEAAVQAGLTYALVFPASTQSRTYQIASSNGFDALIDSPAFNVLKPTDVNGDGNTTVVDAIRVINRINARSPSGGSTPSGLDYSFEDVSGDGAVTAVDALRIINELNSTDDDQNAGGEPIDPPEVAPAAAFGWTGRTPAVDDRPTEAIALVSESTSKWVAAAKSNDETQRIIGTSAAGMDSAIVSPENANDEALEITGDWLSLDPR